MRKILFLLLILSAASAHAKTKTWDFKVFLDGREVGTHRFTLTEKGDAGELRSVARFDLQFLFVTAWRYRHEATERWRDGCLESLVARTENNGEPYAVEWRRGERCEMSFAYWNPRILGATRLLNAQTGDLEPVRFSRLADERWRLSAPGIQIELEYAKGEWVALEALKDGRRLRYVREASG
jgi:hypothetical protein